jgi:hypothetical protein
MHSYVISLPSTKPGYRHTSLNEWHHPGCPCLKKIHQEPIRVKVMHTVACDIYDVIPHCVVPADHTITVKYYQAVLMHHLEHF